MSTVEIYTLRTCPFCQRAKRLLERKEVFYQEYAIDGDESVYQAMLARVTNGKRSVPQIFINNQHIGGCDDLHRLEQEGVLNTLLGISD